jgi:hypothetical protein
MKKLHPHQEKILKKVAEIISRKKIAAIIYIDVSYKKKMKLN